MIKIKLHTNIWERLKHLKWVVVSIFLFLPIPIHVYPLVMIGQARKVKVRSWMWLGMIALFAELALLGSFIVNFGTLSQAMLLTLGGSFISYIVGNGLLLSWSRPYLQRMDMSAWQELHWVPSIGYANRLLLSTKEVDVNIFINRLWYYKGRVKSVAFKRAIARIIELFNILKTNDMMLAERFVIRHETLLHTLKKYCELQESNLPDKFRKDNIARLQHIILQAEAAIEKEVTDFYESSLLGFSAETEAYMQSLRNRKLLK